MATEEYDLSGLREKVSDSVDDAKNDFTDALDSNFLSRVIGMANTSHILDLRNTIEISINSLDEIETKLQQSIDAIGTIITIPDKPDELTTPIDRETEHVFLSERLDSLSGMLSDVYTEAVGNSGYSYENMPSNKIEAISNAIYTKGYDIDEANLKVEVDDLASSWASDGYDVAPGALSFGIAKMLKSFDEKIEGRLNSPASMLSRAIQDNVQWAFENGISIEKLHMGFTESATKFKFDHVNAIIKSYLGEIEKIRMEVGIPIKNIDMILRAAKTDMYADTSQIELELDKELTLLTNKISAVSTKSSTDAGLLKLEADVLAGTVDGYVGLFSTYGSMFSGITVQEQSVEEEGE